METYANETKNSPKMAKLESMIEQGRRTAATTLERIQKQVPVDRILRNTVLDFKPGADGVYLHVPNAEPERLHSNALTQTAGRAGIPIEFVTDSLKQGDWGTALVAHNLNELLHHQKETRYLTRSVGPEVRGFLSNKFRRLGSGQIVEALANACQKTGAVPLDGMATDTRFALRVVLPKVFDINGDVMAFGLHWQNSDFGNGAHSLKAFMLRIICANGATVQEALREVHLGGRLGDDDIWSNRTFELDTQRSASMLQDAVRGFLTPRKINELVSTIEEAQSKKIDSKEMLVTLKKKVGAGTAKRAVELFNSPDVENLPPGNSAWRMSNALSWIAQHETEDKNTAMDLAQAAGELIAK